MGVAGVTNSRPERTPALPVGDVARDGPLDPGAGKGAGTEGLPPGQSGSMAVLDQAGAARDRVVEGPGGNVVLVGEPDDAVGATVSGEVDDRRDQGATDAPAPGRGIDEEVLQVAVVGGRPRRRVEEAVDEVGDPAADLGDEPVQGLTRAESVEGVAYLRIGHCLIVVREVPRPESGPICVVGGMQPADGDRACMVGGDSHAGIVPDVSSDQSGRSAIPAT